MIIFSELVFTDHFINILDMFLMLINIEIIIKLVVDFFLGIRKSRILKIRWLLIIINRDRSIRWNSSIRKVSVIKIRLRWDKISTLTRFLWEVSTLTGFLCEVSTLTRFLCEVNTLTNLRKISTILYGNRV